MRLHLLNKDIVYCQRGTLMTIDIELDDCNWSLCAEAILYSEWSTAGASDTVIAPITIR